MADKPSTTKKRVVKNPETFRERAVKAAEEGEKPSRRSGLKTALKALFKPIVWLYRATLAKLFRLPPFRFLGRVLVPEYFRSSWRELKLVQWPNLKQSRDLTFAVLVFAVVFGATIAIVDFGLDKLFRNILLK